MNLRTLSAVALAGLSFSLAFGSVAIASEVILTGPNGQQTTTQTNRTRQGNTVNVNRTTTLPGGKITNSTGTYTGNGNGTYTGTVDRTNRQGETNIYQVNGQRSSGTGTRQNSGTVTGPNGGESTFNRTGACVNGQCTGNRSVTYPNGQTRNVNMSGTRTAPGTGSGTLNVTGRNGKTRTGTFQRTR